MSKTDSGMQLSAPSGTKSAESRLPSLTGMRSAAAGLVFFFHVAASGLWAPSHPATLFERAAGGGAVGVSFFFVLSGFVLTWSARPGDTADRFWRRRLVKIYPNYVVAWGLALAGLLVAGRRVGLPAALANLFLVQSWWPGHDVYFGVNSVSWSLSCEAFFYLLFPWILPILSRVRRMRTAAAICAAAVLSVPVVILLLPADLRYWTFYIFPPVRLLEFILGMALALIVKNGQWPRIPVWPVALLLLAAYAAVPYFPVDAQPVAVTLVPFALLIPTVAAADAAGRRSLWATRAAVWLGEVSFAFYLVHETVITAVVKELHAHGSGPGKAAAVTLVALVLSTALAAALHRYVEQPMMRRYGRSRPPARHRVGDPRTRPQPTEEGSSVGPGPDPDAVQVVQ